MSYDTFLLSSRIRIHIVIYINGSCYYEMITKFILQISAQIFCSKFYQSLFGFSECLDKKSVSIRTVFSYFLSFFLDIYNKFFSIKIKIYNYPISFRYQSKEITDSFLPDCNQSAAIPHNRIDDRFHFHTMITESILDHRADARVCVSGFLADNTR